MGPWFVTYTREAPVEISLLVVRDEGCLLTVETPTPPLLPERPEIGSAIVVEPDHADHVVGPFTVTCACRALAAFVEGLRATPARRRTARAA